MIILKCNVGSHLYGTNTENSDIDMSGIYMPSSDELFGLKKSEIIDAGIKSKQENGKNDKNAVDYQLYEIKKFITLALQNNPNILEMLFVNQDNIIILNDYGKTLINNRHLFLHKGLEKRFTGYAFAQRKKMVIRTENYKNLYDFNDGLIEYISRGNDANKLLVEIYPNLFTNNLLVVGDLSFQKTVPIKKVIKIISERLSKVTNRKELLLKHGYDTKFASHLIRLLLEGKELLSTGDLVFPLKDKQLILDIKNGKYDMYDVLNMSFEIEDEIKNIKHTLPKKPRYNEINQLTKEIMKRYIQENEWLLD